MPARARPPRSWAAWWHSSHRARSSCPAWPRSPSPRRREPSCATASGASSSGEPPTRWRRPRRPTAAARRSASSTERPSARSTPSPNGSSRSTRSRRSSRRGSRSSTRSPRASPSTAAGRGSSTTSWATPIWSARCSSSTPPTSTPRSSAPWPSPSMAHGTSWRTACRPPRPSRPRWPRRCPASCGRSTPWASQRPLHRPDRQAARTGGRDCRVRRGAGARGDDDLDLLELPQRAPSAQLQQLRQGALLAGVQARCRRPDRRGGRGRGHREGRRSPGCARHLGSAMRRHTLQAAPGSASRRAASSSTTCSCSPGRSCAIPCRVRSCAPRCATATSACCSTSSRTPIRSRSSWPCGSPAPIRARPTPTGGPRCRWNPAGSSSSATPSSRSTGSAGPTSAPSSKPRTASRPRREERSSSRRTSARSPRSSSGSTSPSRC